MYHTLSYVFVYYFSGFCHMIYNTENNSILSHKWPNEWVYNWHSETLKSRYDHHCIAFIVTFPFITSSSDRPSLVLLLLVCLGWLVGFVVLRINPRALRMLRALLPNYTRCLLVLYSRQLITFSCNFLLQQTNQILWLHRILCIIAGTVHILLC